MATTTSPHRCDYVPLDESSRIFAEQITDLARIDEQITHLDNHIHQLKELRSALIRRSNQLRSPSYTIPIEVLSLIFQELITASQHKYSNPPYDYYKACCAALRESFIVSSISTHFRRVALGTPELWERIGFHFNEASIHRFTAFLEHCASRARPRVLSLRFYPTFVPSDGDIRSITDALFSPNITRKVHILDLGRLPPWLSLPSISSTFPVLNAVRIHANSRSPLDLRELPLSQVTLWGNTASPISLPPSVRYLHVREFKPLHLLHQCPNLVECFIEAEQLLDFFDEGPTLCHLKRLTCEVENYRDFTFQSSQVVRDSRMPSLEYLKLQTLFDLSIMKSAFILRLSREVSSTLTFLVLRGITNVYATLERLFTLPMPNLQCLTLRVNASERLVKAVRILTSGGVEPESQKMNFLPSLRLLGLDSLYVSNDFPPAIFALLKRRGFGLSRDFHLGLPHDSEVLKVWTPELLEELRLIAKDRHLKVTWGRIRKIEWL